MDQINQLKNRIKTGNKKVDVTFSTELVMIAKELGCMSDLFGRNFEISNARGEIIYFVRQKPVDINLLETLSVEINKLRELEEQSSKKSLKKRGR